MSLQSKLSLLAGPEKSALLTGIVRGIEKESLRVDPTGHLAMTPHPRALGSTLTHPSITTDYSEALLEFITAPSASIDRVLDELDEIPEQISWAVISVRDESTLTHLNLR